LNKLIILIETVFLSIYFYKNDFSYFMRLWAIPLDTRCMLTSLCRSERIIR